MTTKEQQLAADIVDAMMDGMNKVEFKDLPLPEAVARVLLAMGWDKLDREKMI